MKYELGPYIDIQTEDRLWNFFNPHEIFHGRIIDKKIKSTGTLMSLSQTILLMQEKLLSFYVKFRFYSLYMTL